ncbi:MAG TPA: CBS domain-containing protein [Membranihabitans sp.]|nr:CBS domain-containing protein [Membranihabitans sp.]
MTTKELISTNFKLVSITNTAEEALAILDHNKTRHIPLLKSKALLTVIDEDSLKASVPSTPMSEFVKSGSRVFVRENEHMLEAARRLYKEDLTMLPVLDEDDTFLGVVTLEQLFKTIINSYDLDAEGNILIIEVDQQHFHLSELVRILEQESVHVFSVLVSRESLPLLEITLKTDLKDINTIIQTLERYSYKIKAYFEDNNFNHQLKDRYEALMSYLNI